MACENLEEIENFLREQGYVSNDFSKVVNTHDSIKRHLMMDEIAEFLLVRDDLKLNDD